MNNGTRWEYIQVQTEMDDGGKTERQQSRYKFMGQVKVKAILGL
jgi:hypothetical protein